MKNTFGKVVFSFIILIVLLVFIIIIFFNMVSIHFISKDVVLIDNSKKEVVSQWERPLIVNGKEVCRFSSDLENAYSVWYKGDIYKLKEALEKDIVKLEELQKVGLPCD